jgi:hypothetical protein
MKMTLSFQDHERISKLMNEASMHRADALAAGVKADYLESVGIRAVRAIADAAGIVEPSFDIATGTIYSADDPDYARLVQNYAAPEKDLSN